MKNCIVSAEVRNDDFVAVAHLPIGWLEIREDDLAAARWRGGVSGRKAVPFDCILPNTARLLAEDGIVVDAEAAAILAN